MLNKKGKGGFLIFNLLQRLNDQYLSTCIFVCGLCRRNCLLGVFSFFVIDVLRFLALLASLLFQLFAVGGPE